MKLLKIVNSNDEGGVLTCETQFLYLLKKKGVKVDLIIVGNGKKLETYKSLANKYYQLPNTSISFAGGIFMRILSIWRAFLYGFKHMNIYNKLDKGYIGVMYRRENLMFLAALLSFRLNSKCFWHMANSINSKLSRYVYNILSYVLRIHPIANSNYTKNTFGTRCKHVVYPGYSSLRIFDGQPTYRDRYKTNESEVIFGMLTRIDEFKAIDIVISAFKEAALGSRGLLLIAGGPLNSEYANYLLEICKDEKNIKFVGKVDDVNNFYASVDVMINGRKNAEPFGITIAESLAVGIPVISYYKGGPSEMITDGVNGWLIKGANIEEYRDAIVRAISDYQTLRATSMRIKEGAQCFSAESNVDKLLEIIQK